MNKRRPRLLFLTFYFPPVETIASVRTGNIAKYLTRLGWDIQVVTPHPSLFQRNRDIQRLEEIQLLGIRHTYTNQRWRFLSKGDLKPPQSAIGRQCHRAGRFLLRSFFTDSFVGWYGLAEKACEAFAPGTIDAVLTSGGPWGSLSVAGRIARRLNCPFLLDYRDLWTTNPYASTPSSRQTQAEERSLLRDCAAVTTVSPRCASAIRERCTDSDKVQIISNGYDPDDLKEIPAHPFDHFAIVYAGQFYPPKSNIRPLLQALRQLERRRPGVGWRLHYYGPDGNLTRLAADESGLRERIVDHGRVSRGEVLSATRGAGVAVVIASVLDTGTPADLGIVTGKVFEPIGLGTPVLAIAPRGSDLEDVVATAGRGRTFQGSNTDGMASYIADLMSGKRPPANRPKDFAWPNLAQKLDMVLRPLVGKNQFPQPRRRTPFAFRHSVNANSFSSDMLSE